MTPNRKGKTMAKKIIIDETLSNLEKVALDKAGVKGNGLTAGDHDFDVTVNLKGTIRKGEDSEFTPTASIPTKKAFALFVQHCGITRDAALNALQKAMTEAADEGINAEDAIASVDEMEAKVKDMLDKLPKKTASGKTTVVSLTVTKVEPTMTVSEKVELPQHGTKVA